MKKLIRKIISNWLYKNVGYDLEAIEHMVEEVPKVYCHITNGELSKCNYHASTVIAVSDDCVTKLIEENK